MELKIQNQPNSPFHLYMSDEIVGGSFKSNKIVIKNRGGMVEFYDGKIFRGGTREGYKCPTWSDLLWHGGNSEFPLHVHYADGRTSEVTARLVDGDEESRTFWHRCLVGAVGIWLVSVGLLLAQNILNALNTLDY